MLEQAREDHEELVFDTVIRRKSRIVEYSHTGIQSKTKPDREALQMYESFIEELLLRVKS
nr:hypothetical protein [Bacilli bacterium]